VTYIAVITTSNPDLSLFPGMTANVRIVVDTRDNVLKLPNAALRFRPAGVADVREPVRAAVADQGDKGAGRQAGQAARERLVKELDLDAEQQAKLEAIFSDTRDRIRALTIEDQNERRKQVERLRAESRVRIADMLNPEQRARYEAMGAARRGSTSGRVWVVDDAGLPKAVNVRLGLSDGSYTELVSSEFSEGVPVIVGMAAAEKGQPAPAAGPRFGF
jgi:HlyD family secretion protein